MRPIKFRAWDKRRNRMIEVTSISFRDGTIQEDTRYAVNRKIYLDDVVLMQYTGLKDKNGVEIYEGHIVETPSSKTKYLVDYVEGCFVGRIKHREYTNLYKALEVIGNVYENPELLEE